MARSCRRGRLEAIAVILVLLGLLVLVAGFLTATSLVHNADSATLYQMVRNTLITGLPRTSIGGSSLDAALTWPLQAAEVCRLPLWETGGVGWNILGYHAYLITYPLSLVTLLAPADEVVATVIALGYLAVLGLCYLTVRRRWGSPLAAVLVALLVAAHPIWSRGLMADFYLDRLFLPLGFLLLFLIHDPIARGAGFGRGRWAAIAVTALLAAATNDRSSFYVGLIFAGMLVLYWPRLTVPARLILASLAGLFAGWLVLYTKLLMSNAYVGTITTTLLGNPDLIIAQALSPAGAKLMVIDFLCFGLLALFEIRLALLAAAAVLPNLLVMMGGVEKFGFYSHYHSQYFAILAYAVACGTGRLWALSARQSWSRPGLSFGVAALVCGIGLLLTADDGAALTFTGQNWSGRAFARVAAYYTGRAEVQAALDAQHRAKTLRTMVPKQAAVSTVEGYLPAFYAYRNTTYYPINIDRADYLVLPFTVDDRGQRLFTGAISYTGQAEALDACLNRRLAGLGYDLDHPLYLDSRVAVLKRSPRPSGSGLEGAGE